MKQIDKVAVLGAGTMAPGMAQTYAMSGRPVTVWSRVADELVTARRVIEANLRTFIRHDLVKPDDVEPILARLTFTTDFEAAVDGADLVNECIIEKLDIKREIFERLDRTCPEGPVFTSNTSYLNIYRVTPARRQSSTIIAHWFAPPHIVPLVEVVRGPETSDRTVETVAGALTEAGKVPVVMEKFVPGFAINRILRILGRETFFLLDNGYMTAEQLDLAVKASIAPRMMLLGLVQRYDFTGLDLSARNLQNPDYLEPPIDNRPQSLFDLVEQGHCGVKTGKGFYDYSGKPLEEVLQERDDGLIRILKCVDFVFRK